MNEGWICPRCRKVNAPDVKECSCNECNWMEKYIEQRLVKGHSEMIYGLLKNERRTV